MDVVDREDNWPVGGEYLQRAPNRDTKRARVEPLGIFVDHQCDFECVAPRWWQRGQDVVENRLEQVAKPGMREPSLRFGGPRHENTQTIRAGRRDASVPEDRLPDTRLALEHESEQAIGWTLEEASHA